MLTGSSYFAKDSLWGCAPPPYRRLLSHRYVLQLACGICFGPTLSVVGHWFKKRRGIALGITAAGSSIGGAVFPIAARNLIDLVGSVIKCTEVSV
jgi:MFS family permease